MASEKRSLVITPNEVSASIFGPDRSVCLHLDLDPVRTEMLIDVAVRMSPDEARQIGQMLLRKADEAEAGPPSARH